MYGVCVGGEYNQQVQLVLNAQRAAWPPDREPWEGCDVRRGVLRSGPAFFRGAL